MSAQNAKNRLRSGFVEEHPYLSATMMFEDAVSTLFRMRTGPYDGCWVQSIAQDIRDGLAESRRVTLVERDLEREAGGGWMGSESVPSMQGQGKGLAG